MEYSTDDSDRDGESILEDSDYEIQELYDDTTTFPVVNDMEFIATYAADIPVFGNNSLITTNCTTIEKSDVIEDNSSDDDDSADDALIENDGDVASSLSSDSSDSDDDSNNNSRQHITKCKKTLTSMLTEEEDDGQPIGPPRTKNEVLDTVLYPVNDTTVVSGGLVNIGQVLYRIDQECTVVVQAKLTVQPLNEGSLLCNEQGIILGRIQETFGPITMPFYVVRWVNSKEKVDKSTKVDTEMKTDASNTHDNELSVETNDTALSTNNVNSTAVTEGAASSSVVATAPLMDNTIFVPGTQVYVAQSHSSYVTPGVLIQQHGKGSDASNAHDEEPPEDELEYSDDEMELQARQARNRMKRAGRDTDPTSVSAKQQPPRSRNKLQSAVPSYSHNSTSTRGVHQSATRDHIPTQHQQYAHNQMHGVVPPPMMQMQPPLMQQQPQQVQHFLPPQTFLPTTGAPQMMYSSTGVYLGSASPQFVQHQHQQVFHQQYQPQQQPMQQFQNHSTGYYQCGPGRGPVHNNFAGSVPQPIQFLHQASYSQQPQQQPQQPPQLPFQQHVVHSQQQQQQQQPFTMYNSNVPQTTHSYQAIPEPQYRAGPIQQQLNSALFTLPPNSSAAGPAAGIDRNRQN